MTISTLNTEGFKRFFVENYRLNNGLPSFELDEEGFPLKGALTKQESMIFLFVYGDEISMSLTSLPYEEEGLIKATNQVFDDGVSVMVCMYHDLYHSSFSDWVRRSRWDRVESFLKEIISRKRPEEGKFSIYLPDHKSRENEMVRIHLWEDEIKMANELAKFCAELEVCAE